MRLRTRRLRKPLTALEISLTPLIDTALTLLIIFMVTTPMIQQAIKVALPQGNSNEARTEKQEIVVSINKQGALFLNNKELPMHELGTSIRELITTHQEKDRVVWVRSDGESSCSTLISVIDCIKVTGGIKNVNVAIQKKAATAA